MKVGLRTVLPAVAGLVSFTPHEALADTKIALDLDYAVAIDQRGVDSGGGGALRLGQELDLVLVSLTPEIGGSYHAFSGALEASHYSGFVGARVAFFKVIEPAVFAHIGIAKLTGENSLSDTGPAFDAGLALDFTLLPILDLGVHGAYHNLVLDGGENLDWAAFGAHVALGF